MTRRSLRPPDAAQDPAGELRDARNRLADPAYAYPAAADSVAVLDADDPGCAERDRLRRKAAVHSQVASWICELMQGNIASRGDLRRRLAALRFPGAPASGARAAAVIEPEVQTLERIIAWQARTVASHLGEARRLRNLAGHLNGPEDAATALAPGQTISGETTPQPGGCGQAEGA